METEIHLFETNSGFFVVTADHSSSHPTRQAARARANEMARRSVPSRVIPEAPTWWTGPSPIVDDGSPDSQESPADSHLIDESTVAADRHPNPPITPDLLAGPDVLGRSILLGVTGAVPQPWDGSPEVTLATTTLGDPDLHATIAAATVDRRRLVIRVVDDLDLTTPPTHDLEGHVWSLDATFEPVARWTLMLATRNAVDARGATAHFPPRDLAVARGAVPVDDGTADVRLADGTQVWIDGGPLRLTNPGDLGLTAAIIPLSSVGAGSLAPLQIDVPTAELAPDQLAAVGDPAIPARIIAPAGSGKTRVLVERARHLLDAGVATRSMRVVAFNKRAQLEIEERTGDLGRLSVLTINALALSIINGRSGFAARADNANTIDERQVRTLLSSMIKFPRRANTDPAAAWIDALSAVRLGLRSPSEVESSFNGDVDGFSEFFNEYRQALRRNGWVDFDEQIYRAIEILLTEPDVARAAQQTSEVLLVDEFQDLTPAHLLLLRLLAGPTKGIFGVGDDDQTIYGYSGANPKWLVDFDSFVTGAVHHALEVNYRCPAPVVTAARNLLTRNRYRVPKQISPAASCETDPSCLTVITADSPVAATLDRVSALVEDGVPPGSIAVLTRVNTLLTPVEAGLRDRGLPVANRDGVRFLERTGVAAALSWFSLAIEEDRLGAEHVERAARRPSRGISPRVIEWMAEQRDLDGLGALADRLSDQRSAEKVKDFTADLARLRSVAASGTTATIVEAIRTRLGLDRSMQTLDTAHVGRNAAAHSDDLRALVALAHLHPASTSFVGWLTRTIGQPSDDDGVTLATVHKVKGLEWDHVVVHDATSGVFPHRLSTDIEEERRVFHVAITRARRSLTLIADHAAPSLFLSELDEPAAPKAERATRQAGSGSTRTEHQTEPIDAVEGLSFTWGGYDCVVASVAESVTVAVGNATMAIALGSLVTVEGRTRTLALASATRTKAASGAVASENPAAFEALKAWRLARSRADGVPAYVVAKNDTLEAVATALPNTEAELLAVPGMGPKKVELYGDEILACLESIRSPS